MIKMASRRKQFLLTALSSCLENDIEDEVVSGEDEKNVNSLVCVAVNGFTNVITNSRRSFVKIEDFDLTIDRYHPDQFKIMFRMSRSAFAILLEYTKENSLFVSKSRNSGGT